MRATNCADEELFDLPGKSQLIAHDDRRCASKTQNCIGISKRPDDVNKTSRGPRRRGKKAKTSRDPGGESEAGRTTRKTDFYHRLSAVLGYGWGPLVVSSLRRAQQPDNTVRTATVPVQ